MKYTFEKKTYEYNCEICGIKSKSIVPNAKTCGSIKCKNEATKRRKAARGSNLPVVEPLNKEEFWDFIMLHSIFESRAELDRVRVRAEKTINVTDTAHKEILNSAVFGAYKHYRDRLIAQNFNPTIFTN